MASTATYQSSRCEHADSNSTGSGTASFVQQFSKLDARCTESPLSASSRTGTVQQAAASGVLQPIGADPVFLTNSGLFLPQAAAESTQYYGAEEVNPYGTPWGFFPEPMPGYAPGYPVWVSNNLPEKRARQVLQYLADGSFLDPQLSSALDVEMVTYK